MRWVVAAVVAAALAAGLWLACTAAHQQAVEQGAASVRAAVLDAAMQCAAVEGSYPSSLEYLEERYGLVVNHQDYLVAYDAFASNVPPTVVVVPR